MAAAAAAAVEDTEFGFDEAISWLPSHVLDETIWETNKKKDVVKYNYHRHRSKLPAEPFPSSRRHQKQRYWGNSCASGGPGMQAFFLDSGHKSCGTGVFLPQRSGTNNFHSSRRPACSPVLVPSRVVHALNLNVHGLGLQISPRRDLRNNCTRRGELNNSMNKRNGKDDDISKKRCVISKTETSSPDVFLPREWTY